MFDAQGQARAHYGALFDRLQAVGAGEMHQRQSAADLAFLHQGITFTVYGRSEGTERIFPYNLIPRLITAGEWSVLERGLTQRITALNLFLKDVYGSAKVLADGVIPATWSTAASTSAARCRASPCATTSTSRWPAPTWCACPTGRSRCSRTTCACRAG